ncbi:hypothetical protein QTP70_005605 [Hemibagrus guttatus]|uniref:Uncharacterized protein n=1 Tax=Hemibagrus guttatus TaxID=175788 RepID=A0AAE0RHG5_9TELE|nr:hypothetical protein QTP70_005605 [Hemibagrus guttatus]
MPHWEDTPGKTQDKLERLCLSDGLGMPRGPSRRAGGSVWGEGICNIIKKFAKHGTVKNVPGRREKRKIDENSSKVGANGGKSTTSNIQRPEGQPGTVWGHGFNKYTKPSRASWVKAKENTIAEDKTHGLNEAKRYE